MTKSAGIISKTMQLGAHNYHPKEVVFEDAQGALVTDPEGKQYVDMLSAYSAMNFGHCHPEIVQAAKDQLDRVTLSSRAFHNALLGDFYEKLVELTGQEMILPMNTGAEAVETALKTARRWGVDIKGVKDGDQEIIVCSNNFHGRTITIISMSSDPSAKRGFGPFTPGFKMIPFGDAMSLAEAITPNTVAFLVEPVQGEAGVLIPPVGYLAEVRKICTEHRVLMIADEIQTGFGRTGKLFACEHEDVLPDIYVLGKALGGGIMPVSAIAASKEILGVFEPGSHGSTFGGNPLACAVAIKAMEIVVRENFAEQSARKGAYLLERLKTIKNDELIDVRGKGLLIGLEFNCDAAKYVYDLMQNGILAKETHSTIIRFAPPLMIADDLLAESAEKIIKILSK